MVQNTQGDEGSCATATGEARRMMEMVTFRKKQTVDAATLAQTVRTVVVDDRVASRAKLKEEPFRDGPPSTGPGLPKNKVTTSLYTWNIFQIWAIIPLDLWRQFHRAANVYFLIIIVLQFINAISITGGTPTVAPPLALILTVTFCKDAYEDYRRHVADHAENVTVAHQVDLATGEVKDVHWQDIEVGDVIEIRNRELIAADVVVVESSDPNGLCFVMTANLDGETNLKQRKVHTDMKHDPKDVLKRGATVQCELPNNRLNTFEGTYQTGTASHSLGAENVLLRGTQLRNTESIKGVVIYTGAESKIQMNNAAPPVKMSSMTKLCNVETLWIITLQATFCLVAAASAVTLNYRDDVKCNMYIWGPKDNDLSNWDRANCIQHTSIGEDKVAYFFIKFFNYVLIFTNFVPIAHVLTLDIVKLMQSSFMENDLNMYHEFKDLFGVTQEFPMVARTLELSEELGMVDYVFSDKTGTLTCNVMEFRKCSIQGISYGLGTTEIGRAYRERNNMPVEAEVPPLPGDKQTPNVNFRDPDPSDRSRPSLSKVISDPGNPRHQGVHDFFLSLSLNHEVLPEKRDGQTFLSASNPDEAALVYAAQHFDRRFHERKMDDVRVSVEGVEQSFTVLHNLEFSSKRARSSVIVRYADGTIMIFTKGADNVVKKRLSADTHVNPPDVYQATMAHLDEYVNDGLRTLLVGQRKIPDAEYEPWAAKMHAAEIALVNREEERYAVMDEIELGLELMGATAIEDKLQGGVGDTIAALRDGGVKVWMLTGDKVGTAVNIGYSCQLINLEMNMLRCVAGEDAEKGVQEGGVADTVGLTDVDKNGVPMTDVLKAHLDSLIHAHDAFQQEQERVNETRRRDQVPLLPPKESCLVVDTNALRGVEEAMESGKDSEVGQLFLKLASRVKSVICARVSPKQKSKIVAMVKESLPLKVTLSIGDGANDVPMIQTAHIGVGIFGLEGQQAVNSADFAIGQFRFLKPLMLVHGRWNLRRCSLLTCYLFYKNALLVLPQFFLGVRSLFSGMFTWYDLVYQWFNAVYTFLPILFVATFDQDVNADIVMKYPSLYKDGLERKFMTHGSFWRWMFEGIMHGVVCYFFVEIAMGEDVVQSNGKAIGLFGAGIVMLWLVDLVANLRLGLEILYWTGYEAAFITVSILVFYVTWSAASSDNDFMVWANYPNIVFGTMGWMMSGSWFWFTTVLTLTFCLMPMYTIYVVKRSFLPSRADIGREIASGWINGVNQSEGSRTGLIGAFHAEHELTDETGSLSPIDSRKFEAFQQRKENDPDWLCAICSSESGERGAGSEEYD